MPTDSAAGLNHLRSSCNELLAKADSDSDSEHYSEPAEPDGLLGLIELDETLQPALAQSISTRKPYSRRASFIRGLALLCACSLSVGSHYASNLLGPLKSRLQREMGTSHTEFGLLIAAYSLNSTWTPLVGGVLASRLGTTFTSILATGVILLGQIILLLGDTWGSVRWMTLGLFIFGVGISPLSVVQETIIIRFFKSHGLGVSMAFGLIAGKGASFISARTSYPLAEHFGPRAPFYVATFLAALSVIVNLVYVVSSKWLVEGAEAELEASDITEEARRRLSSNMTEAQALENVAEKRKVHFRQIARLGDVFWAYIGLNIFCGMIWSPFTHLAANIIEKRYGMSEEGAANQASYLLAGSLVLYPICGFLVDRFKHRPIVIQLLALSSVLTLTAYTWLAFPAKITRSPVPAIFTFAIGQGFAPLLLVMLVPRIVPLKYVSTALGAHKSMEQTGSTLFQTLAGLVLDIKGKGSGPAAAQSLLDAFLILNVFQLLSIVWLIFLEKHKERWVTISARPRENSVHSVDQERSLLEDSEGHDPGRRNSRARMAHYRDVDKTRREVRRGEFFGLLGLLLIDRKSVV